MGAFKAKTPKSSSVAQDSVMMKSTAEEVVTPASAQEVEKSTEMAQEDQRKARSALRGIRSTYADAAGVGSNGTKTRLG